jgi:serine/threonine protein kinase
MLGDYQIERKLGEGGMGVVYAGVHPRIGKRVAIKVLRKELCSDTASVERFVTEARVVNEIGHPNIVDIFTFGETPGGRSYFVMEWLDGETLRDHSARGLLPLPVVRVIIRTLARALEAAHEKGIVHRDLKPENIFLVRVRGGPPNVKLLDFGIAKLVHTRARLTGTTEMIGTPMYMSPEQARGRDIDHRTDIYSLGAMLFELLVGRPPFVGKTILELISRHVDDPPPHPKAFRDTVPAELDDLVIAMLAKDAAERPSLEHVWGVLGRPLVETRKTAVSRLRRSAAWALGGALALGAGGVVTYSAFGRHEPSPTAKDLGPRTSDPGKNQATARADAPSPRPEVPAPVVPSPRPIATQPTPSPATLALSIVGSPAPEVVVDKHEVVLQGGAITLSPGDHDVIVRGPGTTPVAFHVALAAGEVVTKAITLLRPAPLRPRPYRGAGSAAAPVSDDDHSLMHAGELNQ